MSTSDSNLFVPVVYKPTDSAPIELRAEPAAHTLWMAQKQIADLLNLDVRTVNEHIQNFKKQRGDKANQGIRKFRIPTNGGMQEVEHYNLTVVTYVGFRAQATARTIAFQDWAGAELNRVVSKSVPPLSPQYTPSINTTTDALLVAVQRLVDIEHAQRALQAELDTTNDRVSRIEAITHVGIFGTEIYSVATYLEIHKIKRFNKSDLQKIGIRATRIAERDGYRIQKRHEGVHHVNTYPKSVIEEALSEYEEVLASTRQPRLLDAGEE